MHSAAIEKTHFPVLKKGIFMLGTSNIVLPVIRKNFPSEFAENSRLGYYSHVFSSIEINSTFYKLPMEATISRWASEVTPGFRFSFKLYRGFTHDKNLDFQPPDVKRFMTLISRVADKKGSLLIQFPGSLTNRYLPRLEKLLELLSEYDLRSEWLKAIEFRHRSWYTDETSRLLEKFSAVYVNHDLPSSSPPAEYEHLSGPKYYRFHGTLPRYRGHYNDDHLSTYSDRIKSTLDSNQNVSVYFNNTLGNAFYDALNLQQMISSRL